MKLGIAIEETWAFFNEVFDHLNEHHQMSLFKRRNVNFPFFKERTTRAVFNRDLDNFLASNEVVFFEWASELLAEATRRPKVCGIVTRLHRYEMYQWVDHVNWEAVDKVILVSQAKQREFTARVPEQASKTVVIPEAVSFKKFQTKSRKFNGDIGVLCHLTPRKRVYELILAFYEMVRMKPDLHLHIGGGAHVLFGDYYTALHALVSSLNLKDKVTFYGNVADPQKWFHGIDIFISNSYSEGLQVSPIEAIASGCYCLSHRWDGADELLPADNLYYSDHELVDQILCYCEIPASERQKRIADLQTLVRERFDVDQTKAQIRKVIEDVAKDYPLKAGSHS